MRYFLPTVFAVVWQMFGSPGFLLIVKAAVHCNSVSAVPLARQYPHVGPSKGGVAQSIANRIDRAVYVTKVVEEVPELLRYARVSCRHGFQEYEDIVWSPSDYEREKNCRQSFGRFLVLFLLLSLFLLLRLRFRRCRIYQVRF